jgi:hypothetical protein
LTGALKRTGVPHQHAYGLQTTNNLCHCLWVISEAAREARAKDSNQTPQCLASITELTPQVFSVLHVCLLRDRESTAFEASDAELQSILSDCLDVERIDVRHKLRQQKHSRGTFRLKHCITSEHDDRVNVLAGLEIQEIRDGCDVFAVLVNGILEFVATLIKHLCPLRGISAREQPTAVVLRFDYEDTEARYKDMVYLRGAILSRQRNVIEQVIVRRRKELHQ